MSAFPTTTFNAQMENHYAFIFNTPLINSNGTTSTYQQEIKLEKHESIVIESLHNHSKSLQKELEETTSLLKQFQEINQINYEKVEELKKEREEMREKKSEEMKMSKAKLEKKLEDHQEVIRQLVEDRFQEKEPEDILSQYGPAWSTGTHLPEVKQRSEGGTTYYSYQPPFYAQSARKFYF